MQHFKRERNVVNRKQQEENKCESGGKEPETQLWFLVVNAQCHNLDNMGGSGDPHLFPLV